MNSTTDLDAWPRGGCSTQHSSTCRQGPEAVSQLHQHQARGAPACAPYEARLLQHLGFVMYIGAEPSRDLVACACTPKAISNSSISYDLSHQVLLRCGHH